MATTERMFLLNTKNCDPPGALAAPFHKIIDGSTPPLVTPVFRFIKGTAWWMYWLMNVPPNYDGGGFRCSWKGGTNNTSVGTLELEVGVKKLPDGSKLTDDLGLDTATRTTITDTPPATPQDKLNYSTTEDISHVNAGSPSPGDLVAIIAKRDITDGNTGELQLAELLMNEI